MVFQQTETVEEELLDLLTCHRPESWPAGFGMCGPWKAKIYIEINIPDIPNIYSWN
jgi:hypothetical protein